MKSNLSFKDRWASDWLKQNTKYIDVPSNKKLRTILTTRLNYGQLVFEQLEAAFDLKLQWQARELKELQNEVQELSALLEQRKQARATIIKRRLNELTGINSHLEW